MELKNMKSIPVKIAAKVLGVSEQYVRIGLQRQAINIGSAVKLSGEYTYNITYELLKNYVGEDKLIEFEEKYEYRKGKIYEKENQSQLG